MVTCVPHEDGIGGRGGWGGWGIRGKGWEVSGANHLKEGRISEHWGWHWREAGQGGELEARGGRLVEQVTGKRGGSVKFKPMAMALERGQEEWAVRCRG